MNLPPPCFIPYVINRIASDIWNRSLTASLNFCLYPMYRSVVWTEAWPSRS